MCKRIKLITFDMVKNKLPKRLPESHKGDFGRLLCVCGSKNMPGAAYFCSMAAVRSGVGLLMAAVSDSVYYTLASKISEIIFLILDENENGFISDNSIEKILEEAKHCTSVLVGCGLGWDESTKNIVYNLVRNVSIPMLIDADGINVISENIDILKEANCDIVITPHPKEMARLISKDTEFVLSNKVKCAMEFSKIYGIITVLKSNNTVISDVNGNIYINKIGNAGMAKAGTGDVLSGIISSLLAQKLSVIDAAICGVFIHSASADICREKFSMTSMTPSDIIDELHEVFLRFE